MKYLFTCVTVEYQQPVTKAAISAVVVAKARCGGFGIWGLNDGLSMANPATWLTLGVY
jgi:hypothetical protein